MTKDISLITSRALVVGVLVAGWTVAACTGLTAPPSPEPISSETPVATAASSAPAAAKATAPSATAAPPAPPPSNEKVTIVELTPGKGTGPAAKAGDTAMVLYKGMFADGKEFDGSEKHGNKPFPVRLGGGGSIRGFQDGVMGMKVGQKRKVTIPPSLGYGAAGSPPTIPPNSTLVFELEVVDLKPAQ